MHTLSVITTWSSVCTLTVHSEFLAKPCACRSPTPPNCGQHTGTPPRNALGGLNTAASLVKRFSPPSASVHDATCAPWVKTTHASPLGERSVTRGMPLSASEGSARGREGPIASARERFADRPGL